MKESPELLKHSEYLRELKPLLHPRAFRRNPGKLFVIALHGLIVVGCFVVIKRMEPTWAHALAALVAGHSIACLGLYAHDLSHKTIISSGRLLRVTETLIWMMVGVPATVWRRVHNATHHRETNTIHDPDRWFTAAEKTPFTTAYNKTFYPNAQGIRWNPLIWLHFPIYLLKNSLAAFFDKDAKPTFVTAQPSYSTSQRLAVVFELVLIGVYQAALFIWLEGDWSKFAWASLAPYGVASATLLTYILTNHNLNPLCQHTDPVAGSTSVIVPEWLDKIHSHFSYHTEHHLFPGMDSSHYPKVMRLLEQKFPDRYNRISLSQAWSRLWDKEGFLD